MIITQEMINAARKVLEEKWQEEGECQSCGWHAALYEHNVEDWEIMSAISTDGILELSCLSRDFEDTYDHRGVKIKITEDDASG